MSQSTGTMTTTIVAHGRAIVVDELTVAFGLAPTSLWKARPAIAAQHPDLDKQEWRYEVRDQSHLSLSDAVDGLLAEIGPRLGTVAEYCRSRGLSLSVHVQPAGCLRDFVLGFDRPETLHALARLNATVYIHAENLIGFDAEPAS